MLFPPIRKAFLRPKRYATADAQLVLAFLNLYQVSNDSSYLERSKELASELLSYACPDYSGHCWGYPFDWQNNKAMWPKNTPYITCTPYCYEVFVKLHELTGENRYQDIAESIARFVHDDLHDTPYSNDTTAGSYSPLDNSMVVNASAYRAYVLIDAGKRFSNEKYSDTGHSNLRFILQCQQEDGSWLYGLDTPADNFIDHFHTCFVLKNLYKILQLEKSEALEAAIRQGFAYYQSNLFAPEGRPRSFSKEPRFQVVRLEMYNYAEAITLGSLLKSLIPQAFKIATSLAEDLTANFQRPEGYFTTRTYFLGLKHNFPFLRWPQAQLYYSLSNLLIAQDSPAIKFYKADP